MLANMTRNASGEWRSVEPTKIRRSQKLMGAYYRNELARRLQGLGMAVTPRMIGPVPGFELAGYERSFIDAFSGRRRAILEHLERLGLPEAEIRAVALGHAPGRYTLAAIDEAIGRLVGGGELIEVERRGMDRAFVTDRAVKAERRVLAAMREGRGKGKALANGETVERRLDGTRLTRGQKEAVRAVLLADDLVIGVQGDAGSGKTTMLHEVKELLGERRIHGLAPSAAAARVLQREAGIPSRTLQYFLTRFGNLSDEEGLARARKEYAGSVLAVDEAAMIDTVRMEELLRIAARLGVARVALVGDTAQLRPVEAGQPFRLLQKAGMATATMDEVVRQRDRELLRAVLLSREGEPGAAIEGLGDRVREAPREELGHEAAMYWIALPPEERDDTLLLAPTHAIRRQANEAVRLWLEREGILHGRTLEIDRLVDRRLTRAQASEIGSYEPGDIAVFHRDHYGCRRDDVCTVIGTEEGMVILAHPDGKERRFRPSGNAAWYLRICDTERIELRAGDRIRWTRNHKVPPRSFGQTGAPDLVNGGEAEIVEIDYRRVRFRDGEGREFNLALTNPQLRHLDHAYCSTVHAAQGRTARAAIAVLDAGGAADRELFHVELSRVSETFLLLTDDREALVELLEARAVTEDGALEALGVDPAKIPAVDLEVFAALAEDWKALRRQAEERAAIPFFLPGYGGVMARAAALSTIEDLPEDMRRLTDTMLAEHKEHLARDREVRNLTGRIQESWRRWPELDWAAQARRCDVEELPRYDAWRGEGAALLEAGRTLLGADGDAARHLHGMRGGRAGLEGAVETLERTRLRDEAILAFEARLQEVNVRARAAGTIPHYARGHDVLLEQAQALALLPHLPSRYAATAQRVVADARACESLRSEIVALHGKTTRLLDERFTLKSHAAGKLLVELGDYAAWWNHCKAARRSWQGMLDDPDTWRPHLDRLGEEAAAIEGALDRLAKLRGHDLFDASMKRIGETAQAARGRGILPFHDDAHRDAVDEAKRLARKHELDEEARRRLQAELEEQAARAAEWMVVVKLLRAMGRLERRSLQLEIDAERSEVPRTEPSGWERFQERIRRFTEDARAALDDGTLQAHWESRPDIRESIEKGLLNWESRLDVSARIEKRLPKTEAVGHDRSVPIDDFSIKCGRKLVRDDSLRWTEVVKPRSWGSGESDGAGREEVVQFEGGLVWREAAKYELEDRCTLEVYSRSDDGPLGRRSLSFGTLIGGCWRTYWEDEEVRKEKERKQNRELNRRREIAWQHGPHHHRSIPRW
ncbi:MAG: AAA family ATPase [Rhodospirillales bacterium]|nr:AAA family ATPase [Rhodospirillales bacterium]